LAPVGGGVAVVAACALVVNGLGGTTPAATPGPGSAPISGHALSGTDPLVSIGTFGWLPDGFQVSSITAGPDYGDEVTAATKPVEESVGPVTPPRLTLTRTATEGNLPKYETKEPTTVKGSQKAYFVVNPGDAPDIPADLSLTWQTADGSWYNLGGDYAIHGDELKALLKKVAEAAHTGQTPVPMPFHVEGLPKDVTLGEAMLDDPAVVGQDGFSAGLLYQIGDPAMPTAMFGIEVTPISQKSPTAPSSSLGNVSPGMPAISPAKKADVCKDSNGLHICVSETPSRDGKSALASVGGAKALLDRITSLGTDRANWTTHVVN
ncbi:MAG: hypothetical protein HOW97_41190, partial [Catenulispora sp.]|nr:hypothetical protein [Catenulispora sp.]